MASGAVRAFDDVLADGNGGAVTLSCPVLEQRAERLAPGERRRWTPAAGSELLYVAAGSGTLRVAGEEHRLAAEAGAFLGESQEAEVEAGGDGLDLVVARSAPAEPTRPRVVRYDEEAAADAGIGREFRLLAGCSQATQFVGVVPPGRAKMHNHPYDEVAYVVEGSGVLHWEDGTSQPVGRGSCVYFPRLVFHSLENVGAEPLRIMGVFHPAGSPADRVQVLDY